MIRLLKDKRGSSLVMVVLVTLFLTVLGSTIIMMTISNIRMKASQRIEQKEFYDVETALDDITAGIEDDSVGIAADSYTIALENYSSLLSGSGKKVMDEYTDNFLAYMLYRITDPDYYQAIKNNTASVSANESAASINTILGNIKNDTTGSTSFAHEVAALNTGSSRLKYSDKYLMELIDAARNAQNNTDNKKYYVMHADSDPDYAALKTQLGNDDLENYITVEGNTIVLHNVIILHYNKDNNYDTSIKTNIRVNMPSIDASSYADYINYAMIADNQVLLGYDNSNSKPGISSKVDLKINGNVYGGIVNSNKPKNVAEKVDPTTGIFIYGSPVLKSTVDINAAEIITRGDIVLGGDSRLSMSGKTDKTLGDIWTENIKTVDSTGTRNYGSDSEGNPRVKGNWLEVNDNVYASDDLEINGNKDMVLLSGNYYGYNYAKDYVTDPNKLASEAALSSSISVNGDGSKIRFVNNNGKKLDTLVLSGMTYIENKKHSDEKFETVGATLQGQASSTFDNPDIRLQESLTVKSNQVAYYVPAARKFKDSKGKFYTDPGYIRSAISTNTYNDVVPVEELITNANNFKNGNSFKAIGEDTYVAAFRSAQSAGEKVYNSVDGVRYNGYYYFKEPTDSGSYNYYMLDYNNLNNYYKQTGKYYFFVNGDDSNMYVFDVKHYNEDYLGVTKDDGSYVDVMDYVNLETPFYLYRRNADVGANGRVKANYFYLHMNDTAGHTDFYNIFQQGAQRSLLNEISNNCGVISDDSNVVITAGGNVLYKVKDPGDPSNYTSTFLKSSFSVGETDGINDYNSAFLPFARQYSREYMSRQLTLEPGNSPADTYRFANNDKTIDNLFDTLIDRDLLKSLVPTGTQKDVTLSASDIADIKDALAEDDKLKDGKLLDGFDLDQNTYITFINQPTATVAIDDSHKSGIIVSTGSVKFDGRGFTGLVLSGQDVIVCNCNEAQNVKFNASSDIIKSLLDYMKNDKRTYVHQYYKIFKDSFKKNVSGEIKTRDEDGNSNVVFEDWQKNTLY
ncbi:MAG: pilus assembly PilX N-terminal domain-containing protein [Lachnospiraceae bacterium]|nr:pilus assembly PilX N-terminal domain-containing protein [Lachnospiraceae bacterium]MEE3461867.1 pilus assembly PilX N-terminal domain-containing protein [Lachnospiraceae bacterium]